MLMLDRVTDGDIHTVADFAELLCLLKPDRILSVEDLEDHLVDTCGEVRGRRSLGDVFSHMTWRASAFRDYYAFSVANNQQSISAPDGLAIKQQAYVFLLLCANLPYLERKHYKTLTDAFERAAHLALRRMWPQSAEVRAFGKNNAQYVGTKSERLHKLAVDLGCRPSIDPAKFRTGDAGDGGIDLAAWLTLDDHEGENKFTCLAQCACSRDEWTSKQFEISVGRLGKLFNPTSPWLELICIPICFRNNNGRWYLDSEVADKILIDRYRLLRLIQPDEDWVRIDPPAILSDFLNSRLEVV